MSLAIDIEKVSEVLLADGWHTVEDNSFYLDAYEYVEGKYPDGPTLLGGGQEKLIPATGFHFVGSTGTVYGPLTAILAVKTHRDE